MAPDDQVAALLAWYGRAQLLGLLGPGEPEAHVRHSERFVDAFPVPPERLLDLGTGAGLPGLALALALPDTVVTLIDAKERSISALRGALLALDLADRVALIQGRAEVLAHDADLRERFDAVVSRSFGPPATTAECATGFVQVGGSLWVSEPPDADVVARWPVAVAPGLGLVLSDQRLPGIARLDKVSPADLSLPRRPDLPSRRPLFR